MKFHKHFLISIASFLLLIGSIILPHEVFAQSYRYSSEGSSPLSEEEQQQLSDYRRVSSSIRRKISNLDSERVENVPIPILFGISPKNLTPNFGDPRDGGARTHEGEDILAPKGAPIVSPTDAVVLRTGTGSSSGRYVYTANPGGETFVYMHLNEIADISSGDVLRAGDIIGYVGNTGNASGGASHLHFEIRKSRALDPYPRLTREFPLKDKISYLEDIIDDENDDKDFITFLAQTYQKEFLEARRQSIDLPEEIDEALNGLAVKAVVASSGLDLSIGSSGPSVVALQKFLILKNIGPASLLLINAGATGYFGTITKNALIEYQLSVGITPAVGYYGPITRAYIATHN